MVKFVFTVDVTMALWFMIEPSRKGIVFAGS